MSTPITTADLMAACAEHPGSVLGYPFSEDAAVYKVGGRIFAIVGTGDGPGGVTLKAEPEDVTGLVDTYEAVTRGYHMSKKHWITVVLDPPLPDGLLLELIEDSYDLVVDRLPARDRP